MKQSPYRKALRVGDIVVMKYPEDRHVFGRIMRINAPFGGFPSGCIKVHVYNAISATPSPPADVTKKPLLVAPQWINRLGFSRGYLTVVGHFPISGDDTCDNACYRNWKGQYISEDGTLLETPTALVGDYGMGNYRTMDDTISKSLRIPQMTNSCEQGGGEVR